jgi:hydrogenase maturation protein HypF
MFQATRPLDQDEGPRRLRLRVRGVVPEPVDLGSDGPPIIALGVGTLHAASRSDLAKDIFSDTVDAVLLTAMLDCGMTVASTSSMGRLFDAAAAISGMRMVQTFEGQAAMEFEALAGDAEALQDGYSVEDGILDFRPLLVRTAENRLQGAEAASLFHATIIAGLADWAIGESRKRVMTQVVLSGGCVMNRRLAEGLYASLSASGLDIYLPRALPANDGGLSLGQAAFARLVIEYDKSQVEEP